jgi:hypothetical protein
MAVVNVSSQATADNGDGTTGVLAAAAAALTTTSPVSTAPGALPAPLAQALYKSQQLTAQLYAKPLQHAAVHTAASHLLRRAVASGAVTGIGKGFLDTLTNGQLPHHMSVAGDGAGFGMEPGAVARAVALYNRLTALALWRDKQARAGGVPSAPCRATTWRVQLLLQFGWIRHMHLMLHSATVYC